MTKTAKWKPKADQWSEAERRRHPEIQLRKSYRKWTRRLSVKRESERELAAIGASKNDLSGVGVGVEIGANY